MSEHEKDSLMERLYDRQSMKLLNIKFCRGSRDVITPEELRAESHSALLQDRTGAARPGHAPRSKQPPVDLEILFG